MGVRGLVRGSAVIGAAALLAAPLALQTGYTDGPCPTGLHPVVNTGDCVAGPGGNIVMNKANKLMDVGKCATYKGREYDEIEFHRQTSPELAVQASFVTDNDFDWTDPTPSLGHENDGPVIAVVVDDGSIVFNDPAGTRIDVVDAVKKFMARHGDEYDFVGIFPNFNHAEGSFHNHVKNDVAGINVPISDNSSTFGTTNLKSLTLYRPFTTYPADPYARIAGNNDSTMSLLAQETGHRWAAWVRRDKDPGTRVRASSDLLGRNEAHWCFYTNSTSAVSASNPQVNGFSSMEGNSWVDNGNGTFTTALRSDGYSPLDQYLMGFRAVDDVSPFFRLNTGNGKISPDCNARPYTPGLDPAPYTVSYPKINVSVQDIMAVEGMRVPTASNSQKNWRMAFICLAAPGTTCTTAQLEQLNSYRIAWEPYFQDATVQGRMHTRLGPIDLDGDGALSNLDCDEEDPSIYPGAPEVCNMGVDDNCDGFVDEGFDNDNDLVTSCAGDCDDNDNARFPGNPEVYDGKDNNCDGTVDNVNLVDADGDGYFVNNANPALADCNDSDPNVYPGAAEYVNGLDDNCNNVIDCAEPVPPRVNQTDSGPRGSDGFDNDCNGTIDG